jgi:dynein light chain LC8-type
MSTAVKKKCDEQFGGTWHCVIGKNFGCSITHDTKYVMFLKVDLMSALVFKSLD